MEMEKSKFHGLHPLKRFKLRQIEEESSPDSSTMLPAKKRKHTRDSPLPSSPLKPNSTTTYCLPAKKRVFAFQPLFDSPEKPNPSFDLNVEYQQSPVKETKPQDETEVIEEPQIQNDGNDVEVQFKKEEGEDEDGVVCSVCRSTDGDPSDPIVFCDGCDLMVHAVCYGDPLVKGIPEGDWFCFKCQNTSTTSPKTADGLDCCLCPVKGGALKPTTDERWSHIVCALLVPEVFFKNPEGREEIDCSQVPHKRWEEVCYICDSSSGCAIDCSEPKCGLTFHITCGLNEELCIEYKEGRSKRGGGGAIVAGFCKTHTNLWEKVTSNSVRFRRSFISIILSVFVYLQSLQQQQTGKFKIVARD
ncbi:hypothetical protein GIB67_038986 [Kingdonia uniflora]|uniref:Uncharacterized protein n=1 Tax=Kingdonia uniflora TaxID=39325 RepID=A0A7J7P6X1_9MAGN|nr:hypothetical protein GIB67_038986 [Kingdonia uniflora]